MNDSSSERPKTSTDTERSRSPKSRGRRRVWLLVGILGLSATVLAIQSFSGGLGASREKLQLHSVQRGDLVLNVIERGSVESQSREKIVNRVDDFGEGRRSRGTPILFVVPNGTRVKKGDLLVELDVTGHQERLDVQTLATQEAESENIQAQAQLENQVTQNETNLAEAELALELAKLALEQFEDESGGTFQIQVQDVELAIQEAQASRMIEETNLAGVEKLYSLGYRSQGELAQARLSSMRAEQRLAGAIAKKKELVAYEYQKSKLQLTGQVASAKRSLTQVERDNKAILTQVKALADAAERGLKKEKERLARYEKQVEKGKIYAPADGMAAYGSNHGKWYYDEIRVGATIRPRQEILSIPDLKRMQVRLFVHESVLDKVTTSLKAVITAEAVPGQSYTAMVKSVAVLADQGRLAASGTKVYETVVEIDDEVFDLKPGMSAKVVIGVAVLENVISVPVQAIVQRGKNTWCFARINGKLERHAVELGMTNDKFVEVKTGIPEGAEVVLNPDAILEDKDGDDQTEISPDSGASEIPQAESPKVDGDKEPAKQAGGADARKSRSGGPGGEGRARRGGEGRSRGGGEGRRGGGGSPRRPGGGRPGGSKGGN